MKSDWGSLQSHRIDSNMTQECPTHTHKQTWVGVNRTEKTDFGNFRPEFLLQTRQISDIFRAEQFHGLLWCYRISKSVMIRCLLLQWCGLLKDSPSCDNCQAIRLLCSLEKIRQAGRCREVDFSGILFSRQWRPGNSAFEN